MYEQGLGSDMHFFRQVGCLERFFSPGIHLACKYMLARYTVGPSIRLNSHNND